MSKQNKDDDDIIDKFQKNTLFLNDDINSENDDSEDEQKSYKQLTNEEKFQKHENDTIKMIYTSFLEEIDFYCVSLCEYLSEKKIQVLLDDLGV